MFRFSKDLTRKLIFLIFAAGVLGCVGSAFAEGTVVVENTMAEQLNLVSGKSKIMRSSYPVSRVSVANPEIADILLLTSREIYITGKASGTTNLTLWREDEILAMYDVNVSYDLSALKEQAYEMFSGENDLKVLRMHDTITLSGRVSSANVLSQVLALAKAYAPEGKIANLVEVGGGHQVMLEVRVAEISKSTSKELGINFNAVSGENFFVSTLAGLSSVASDSGSLVTTAASSVNALMRFSTGSVTWTGLIDALQEDGMVKILAKPTLTALSGQEASFLAGGEFPVPVPQGLGTAAIEYKQFGVALAFKPVVLSHDRINIAVTPEVSELDFSTAIQFGGYVVPGLNSRRATTTIELGDGQSFAIAGLLKDNVRDSISKFPLLGDIPILGALFRSRSFQKSETELIIIVTPRLVKPLNMAEQTLPTDFYIEPNNWEIYLEGTLQGKAPRSASPVSPEMEGEFGHSLPDAE